MPLIKSSSKSAFGANVSELLRSKPSSPRSKAINTIARKGGISTALAKRKQAVAIAFAVKRKGR